MAESDDWLTTKIIKQILDTFSPTILLLIAMNVDWLGPLGLRLIQMLQLLIGQVRGGGDDGRADAGRRKRMATMSGEMSDLFDRLKTLEAGKGRLLLGGWGLLKSMTVGARQMIGV